MKRVTFILLCTILFLSLSLHADFKISGSNGEILLTEEELKDMPREAFIEFNYKVYKDGKTRDVAVRGLSLRYLLLERAGVNISDGDVILLKNKATKIEKVSYKDLMNSYAKFVIAVEEDGKPNNGSRNGYNIYSRSLYSSTDAILYHGVVGLKFGAEINLSKTPEAKIFSDITEDFRYAKSAIHYLYQKGIISGVGSGKFAPNKTITRAEMSKIANLSIGSDKVDYKGNFRDVSHTDWFAPYVAQSIANGFFVGYDDGSFRPTKSISRQEFCVVVARLAVKTGLITNKELENYKISGEIYADAHNIARYAKSQVAWVEAKGALDEITRVRFEPHKPITRAEACRVLYVALFK